MYKVYFQRKDVLHGTKNKSMFFPDGSKIWLEDGWAKKIFQEAEQHVPNWKYVRHPRQLQSFGLDWNVDSIYVAKVD